MFEKEAEEYAEGMAKYYESAHGSVPSQFEKYLRKAVEYGYRKANEWHYVKDGDLPKDDNYVLVSNGKDWTKAFYKNKKWNIICLVGFTKIIAWKEIVLPELKESE